MMMYAMELLVHGVTISSILTTLTGGSIINSDFDTESGSSLIFGFYSLFFLMNKNYYHFLISLLLIILGAKRIAIAGVLISVILYFLYPFVYKKWISKSKKTFLIITTFILFLLAHFWTLIYTGVYDKEIHNLTGISPNAFFMGRLNRVSQFFDVIKDSSNYFTGYGFGYVENVLYYSMNLPTPFHNDFYRMFLEMGAIFFFSFIYILLKFAIKNRLAFSSLFLLLILMQTDNVLIYETVMYSFYIIFFSSIYYKTGNTN
tara:strand:+ start:392 stop:1171 length:780 start_codon:yes stop_codon:yes gene_type:complete